MMRNMKMRITKCFPPSHIHMTLETCYVLALFMQQNDFVIVIMCAPFCIALFPILTVTVIAADFMAFIQSFEFTLKLPGFNSHGRLTEIARYYQNDVAANETENEHLHTSMRDDEHEHWTHSIPTTALHITLSKCVISLWLFQCSKMFRSLHSNFKLVPVLRVIRKWHFMLETFFFCPLFVLTLHKFCTENSHLEIICSGFEPNKVHHVKW